MQEIYVTKYALTSGAYKTLATIENDVMAVEPANKAKGAYFDQCFHKGDWFFSKDEALARCEELRITKLKSIDKQAKKISALKFEF